MSRPPSSRMVVVATRSPRPPLASVRSRRWVGPQLLSPLSIASDVGVERYPPTGLRPT
jgi:hypothetical protein